MWMGHFTGEYSRPGFAGRYAALDGNGYLGFDAKKGALLHNPAANRSLLRCRCSTCKRYYLRVFIIGLVAVALYYISCLCEEYGLQRRYKASPEALMGGFLLFSLIILGMSGISLGENIQLLNIVCPLLVLSGAYLWGPVWGVTAGLIIGCASHSNR